MLVVYFLKYVDSTRFVVMIRLAAAHNNITIVLTDGADRIHETIRTYLSAIPTLWEII